MALMFHEICLVSCLLLTLFPLPRSVSKLFNSTDITDSLMAKDAWFGLAETWFDCTDIPSSKNFLLTTSTSSNSNSKKTSTSSTAPTTTSMMTSSDCDLKTPFSEDGSYLQPDFADVTNYLQINNNINSSNNNNTLQSLQ
ncbi:hypothetical protein HELRODRAFT_184193 [Helobdella robusta]|uniref:Uncharacterized protein n=1 Tax=Helobdella robusta TaxID=6412 RepID=T1FKQ9_HELRO|nr:hypothetical protein HELRODRAFT_184193 [Helobdella robusta]ESO05459.1 hypothetical protein HELRODRAFT_184193 [Helobdella robusta]